MIRKINVLYEPFRSLSLNNNVSTSLLIFGTRTFSTIPTTSKISTPVAEVEQKKNVSKAMKAYLERAREHNQFMAKQQHQYEIGKRHLANMMGENPETFTQKDIDEAIEYLFPSGLYDKKARPLMKPPEEVFPQRKAAEFDETGRPYHFLFYTGRPNFYQILYDAVQKMNELYHFEDAMIRKGLQPDPNMALDISGYQWIDKRALEVQVVETLSDRDYNSFINALERLSQLPYSYREKEFIFQFNKPLMSHTKTYDAIKPHIDQDGNQIVTVYECLRKSARGTVTLKVPGTGKITINGENITYFKDMQSRDQLLFPLLFCNMETKVDIEAEVVGGGPTGQAGTIRWGIAWGLRSFVDRETIERMRLAGLLTKDIRRRERKKPGQAGARRKFTWKKR